MPPGGAEEDRAPICASCGVTALPAETGEGFVCENPDCPAYGDQVDAEPQHRRPSGTGPG